MSHKISYRVYYEDTDAGGVVYYANYLKFAERARTEYLRAHGVSQQELVENEGVLFVVRKAEVDLMKPAKLDDLIAIETAVIEQKAATIRMEQNIYLEKTKLCTIKVQLVVINKQFRPIRMPEFLKEIFKA